MFKTHQHSPARIFAKSLQSRIPDVQQMRRRLVGMFVRERTSRAESTEGSVPRKGLYQILVCRPNHRLGNLLLLTPLLAELAHCYPGAQVDLVVGGKQTKPLFEGFPNVGKVYALPRHALRQPWRLIQVLRQIRQQHYDLAIDPDVGSNSSRVLVNHVRARHRIGFAGRKPMGKLDCAMPIPTAIRHMGQLPVALIRWAIDNAGVASNASAIPALDLRLAGSEREWGKQRLEVMLGVGLEERNRPTIALYTHATAAKRHEDEWWLQLLRALRCKFPQARFVEILPAHGESGLDGSVPGYYSSKRRRVAAIIAATQMVIVADSGIMHLACASRGPTVVGLFRCTDPDVYGPYGSGSRAISTNGHNPLDICDELEFGDCVAVSQCQDKVPKTVCDIPA